MGRWLAHHLAELIKEAADKKKTTSQRTEARKQAATLILKLWDRRMSLPGNAYPLAKYRDVLRVLDLLRSSANPWQRQNGTRYQILAAKIFDNLCRLVILLLSVDISLPQNGKRSRGNTSVKFLSKIEQAILKDLETWPAVVRVEFADGKNAPPPEAITIGELLRMSADDALKNLHELREFIETATIRNSGAGTKPSSA
jgi:hypothetical protein